VVTPGDRHVPDADYRCRGRRVADVVVVLLLGVVFVAAVLAVLAVAGTFPG
jgi:hypothetical protein